MSSQRTIPKETSHSCSACGGKVWEYTDYDSYQQERIHERRCLEINCGFQHLIYGDEVHKHFKSPAEVSEFIKEYELEDELEE
tara:strand:- start:104 stop:352 length:249 start_codon:yes stop_codon:yes gene_type:complete